MSLHTRYRPTPFHAGPSAQSVPMCRRLMEELKTMYFWKRGSSAMMSGSGYGMGPGTAQSRGVGTGDTAAGWPCANARADATAEPIAAPRNARLCIAALRVLHLTLFAVARTLAQATCACHAARTA